MKCYLAIDGISQLRSAPRREAEDSIGAGRDGLPLRFSDQLKCAGRTRLSGREIQISESFESAIPAFSLHGHNEKNRDDSMCNQCPRWLEVQ